MNEEISTKREKTVEEAIQVLWKIIDEARSYLEDEMTNSEEKRRWAKVLCDTIGVLNKLLASRGQKPLEGENLGTLLLKVPRTLRRTIMRRAGKWRKMSS